MDRPLELARTGEPGRGRVRRLQRLRALRWLRWRKLPGGGRGDLWIVGWLVGVVVELGRDVLRIVVVVRGRRQLERRYVGRELGRNGRRVDQARRIRLGRRHGPTVRARRRVPERNVQLEAQRVRTTRAYRRAMLARRRMPIGALQLEARDVPEQGRPRRRVLARRGVRRRALQLEARSVRGHRRHRCAVQPRPRVRQQRVQHRHERVQIEPTIGDDAARKRAARVFVD